MMTVRQIERAWTNRTYEKLLRELLATRPEGGVCFEVELGRSVLAAAMAVIRLDELNQSHAPLYSKLVRAIIAGQEGDGGWGDAVSAALCLRALFCGNGQGEAIERGLNYLATLQKPCGVWPAVPIRRMPADADVSAFVLYQMAGQARFREAVRFADALAWFDAHAGELPTEASRLWDRLQLRRPLWREKATVCVAPPDMWSTSSQGVALAKN